MPIPMVVCSVCLCSVSKRSTVSLYALGGEGRACRVHEEVAMLVEQAEQRRMSHVQRREALQSLGVMIAAAAVRVRYSFQGFDPEEIYRQFQMAGIQEGHLQQIRAEVSRLGGPQMTQKEMRRVAFDASRITSRCLSALC